MNFIVTAKARPELSPERAAELFAQVYPAGGVIESVVLMPRGFEFEVWLVQATSGRYALKVARVHANPARVSNAVVAHRLAADAGVPGPRIVAWAPRALHDRPLYVQEWLPGRDAEAAWAEMDAATRIAFTEAFAHALSTLHSVPGPCFSDDVTMSRALSSWAAGLHAYVDKNEARIRTANLLSPAQLQAALTCIKSGIAALPENIAPRLTHWDLWLGNTLADERGAFAGMLDWQSAAFSDPLVDFVKLEVWLFDRHPETRAPFLDAYWRGAAVGAGVEARINLYRGVEYLTHVYYYAQLGLAEHLADYRKRLDRWLDSGDSGATWALGAEQ